MRGMRLLPSALARRRDQRDDESDIANPATRGSRLPMPRFQSGLQSVHVGLGYAEQ